MRGVINERLENAAAAPLKDGAAAAKESEGVLAMEVRMTFNDTAIQAGGYRKEDIYYTIKSAFAQHGIHCTSDGDVLAFEDSGHEDDYANMWNVIKCLMVSGWYLACAASCDFIDDGEIEDVLAQAYLFNKKSAV